MAELRAVLTDLGFGEPATLLQSGNAAFTTQADDEPATLAASIEGGLRERLGLDVRVLVRTPAEVRAVIASNPFPGATGEPGTLLVAFLETGPAPERLATLPIDRYAPDELRVGDRVLYLHLPAGAGRSKLAGEFERRLGVVATARNWNTVNRLLDLAGPGAT